MSFTQLVPPAVIHTDTCDLPVRGAWSCLRSLGGRCRRSATTPDSAFSQGVSASKSERFHITGPWHSQACVDPSCPDARSSTARGDRKWTNAGNATTRYTNVPTAMAKREQASLETSSPAAPAAQPASCAPHTAAFGTRDDRLRAQAQGQSIASSDGSLNCFRIKCASSCEASSHLCRLTCGTILDVARHDGESSATQRQNHLACTNGARRPIDDEGATRGARSHTPACSCDRDHHTRRFHWSEDKPGKPSPLNY